MWSLQSHLYNEVFDDDLDGKEGAGKGETAMVSPRQDYMKLAAVPRFSRPSMELQVTTASALEQPFSLSGLRGGGVSAPRNWEASFNNCQLIDLKSAKWCRAIMPVVFSSWSVLHFSSSSLFFLQISI